jgi:hypothetical protein
MTEGDTSHFDAVVIGAGVMGMYMIYKLQSSGFTVRGYEAGADVGRTWFWNRYPGCRLDTESFTYSYLFLHDIVPEWTCTVVSLNGVYDCRVNRKAIFNRGMVPNINSNLRGGSQPKQGGKPIFGLAIFKERFWTIERVLAWEDKFRRLLLRFESWEKRR